MTGIKDSFLSSKMFVYSLRIASLSSYKTILIGSSNRAFFEKIGFGKLFTCSCEKVLNKVSVAGSFLISPKSPVVEATFPKRETYFGGS